MSDYDYTCTVVQAGSTADDDGGVRILLKDIEGSFNRWFSVNNSSTKKEMLAVALTAISLGAKVAVRLESDKQYSEILFLYIIV